MICNITKEQQDKLFKAVWKRLDQLVKDGKPFNLKDQVRSIYDLFMNKNNDQEQAIAYARLVPSKVFIAVTADRTLLKGLKPLGLDLNLLDDVVESFEESIDNAIKYLDLNNNEIGIVQKAMDAIRDSLVEGRIFPTPGWYAKSVGFLNTTEGNEADNIKNDPSVKFYYDVQRQILDEVFKNNSGDINFSDVGPVHLKLISIAKVPLSQRKKEPARETGVLILVDGEGNPVYLNGEFKKSSLADGGRLPYWSLRKADRYIKLESNGNVIFAPADERAKKDLEKAIQHLEQYNNTTRPLAERAIKIQLKALYVMQKYIMENIENELSIDIIGGHLGYDKNIGIRENEQNPKSEATSITILKDTGLTSSTFNPTIYKGDKNVSYAEYIDPESNKAVRIYIKRGIRNNEYVSTLANLQYNDVYSEDGTLLTPEQKVTEIEKLMFPLQNPPPTIEEFKNSIKENSYLHIKESHILNADDYSVPVVTKQGEKFVLKQKKINYRDWLLSNDEFYIKTSVPTKYENSSFTISPQANALETIYNDKDIPVVKSFRDQPNVLPVKFKVREGIETSWMEFKSSEIHKEKGRELLHVFMQVEDTNGQYKFVIDGDKIVRMESRTTSTHNWTKFAGDLPTMDMGRLKQLTDLPKAVKAEETKLPEKKEKPIDQKGPADDNGLDNLDDFLRKDKLDTQKASNIPATIQQIKDAEVWYNNHPLNKYFPFKTVFNAINSERPNSVAQWTTNGIILYKGADFSDLYHEAWHGFSQMFLTSTQREDLYNELRKRSGSFKDYQNNYISYSSANNLQLEEVMAEEFREYVLSKGTKIETKAPVKNSIFRRIYNFLKNLFTTGSYKTLITSPKATPVIAELYEKMRVGNLVGYTFNQANAEFNTLYQHLQPTVNGDNILNHQNAKKVVDAVSSLISYSIDKGLKFDTDSEKLKTYKNIKEIFESFVMPKVQKRLEGLENPQAIELVQNDIKLVQWVIDNFGNTENLHANVNLGKGVIYAHILKGRMLTNEDRQQINSDALSETESFVKARQSYDRSGNDNSLLDLADAHVIRAIEGLYEYAGNKPVLDSFGLPKLNDFAKSWNFLAKNLEGTLDADLMLDKLNTLSEDNPMIAQLLGKIRPVRTNDGINHFASDKLWTDFWQAFNKTRVKLIQVTLASEKEDDSLSYDLGIGSVSGVTRSIGTKWNRDFQNMISPYIYEDMISFKGRLTSIKPRLNIEKILNDFSRTQIDKRQNKSEYSPLKALKFLNAIGVNLTNNEDILDKLENDRKFQYVIIYLYNRLVALKNEGKYINSLRDIFTDDDSQKTLAARYNDLLNLEARYGDTVSNFMVLNAESKVQFEHTLNSTLTRIIYEVNKVNSFEQLISMPHMAYLDPAINPATKNSKMLASLFEVDPADPNYFTIKRKEASGVAVELVLENLSGLQSRLDNFTEVGVGMLNADYYGKAVADFHLLMMRGSPEFMRHGDKTTSVTGYVSKIKQSTSTIKNESTHLYVDPIRIIKDMYGETFKALAPYIDSEIDRMLLLRGNNMNEYDFQYKKQGSNFVYFQDVLSKEVKNELLTYKEAIAGTSDTIVNNLQLDNPELYNKVINNLKTYFTARYRESSELLLKHKYISPKLKRSLISKAKTNNINLPTNIEPTLINTYIVNSWIHNMETFIMFYGDLALYKDFHKRNSGINSTGDILRTDIEILNQLKKMGRLYDKSIGISQNDEPLAPVFDTAVMQDVTEPSKYLEEYEKALSVYFKARYTDKEAAIKTKNAIKPYTEGSMEEGDGQGWISFDSYRAMLFLEGKWTPAQENIYKKIVNGEEITEDVDVFFPVKKMQYWGPLKTSGVISVTAMHKFSLMPLIPTVIKGSILEDLHNKMATEGVDYTLFKSASKVGSIGNINNVTEDNPSGADKFYEDKTGKVLSKTKFTKNTIFLHYLKDVLETHDHFTGKITFPTQARKLIIDGLMKQGLPVSFMADKPYTERFAKWDDLSEKEKLKNPDYLKYKSYENIIEKLTRKKYEELIDGIGWKLVNGKPVGNVMDLKVFIKKQLETRDLGEHEIDFLGKDTEDFPYDLSYSLSSDKIETLLNSIVVKRLIKQKINGEALIQVAVSGFEPSFKGATPEETKKYSDKGLKFYTNSGGNTSAMQIKIAIQGKFKNLLLLPEVKEKSKTENISLLDALNSLIKDETWLSQNDNRKMITMIGVRIPTQGLNSMDFMEVAEFLPEVAGNIIIGPSEVVGKSGSDFDIDKLFTMMPNIDVINGKPEYILPTKKPKETLLELNKRKLELQAEKQRIWDEFDNKLADLTAEEKAAVNKYRSDMRAHRIILDGLQNLYALKLKGNLSYERGAEVEDLLYAAQVKEDLIRSTYKTTLKGYYSTFYDKATEPINKELGDIKRKEIALSSKSIENELLSSMKGILEGENNFVNLIRPNGIDIYKDVADELRSDVVKYDEKAYVYPENEITDNKGTSVSPTRALEVGFNLHKHQVNSRGKAVLGIGAKNNTYNVLFNRIGMYLNATNGLTIGDFKTLRAKLKDIRDPKKSEYKQSAAYRAMKREIKDFARQLIYLPHNTELIDGKKVISLSHINDLIDENKISDVISQMINGWVDVAKDDRIFYIQGNKELTPSLLFLIQAGVPLENAVYFLSQPLISKYVESQMVKRSIFSGPFGEKPFSPNRFAYPAKIKILTDDEYGIGLKKENLGGPNSFDFVDKLSIVDKTLNLTEKYNKGFDKAELFSRIKEFTKQRAEGTEVYTDMDRAVFMHFLEIEEMAKTIKDITLATDVDTDKSTTLFEAMNKQLGFIRLEENPRIPAEIIQRLRKDSVLSSLYKVLDYQQDIWQDRFKIKSHPDINKFLAGKFRVKFGIQEDIDKTFEDPEKFAAEFRNEFLVYLLEDSLYNFDLNSDSFKGYPLADDISIEKTKYFPYGALVKDGIMYVDKDYLKTQWADLQNTVSPNSYQLKYQDIKVAPVSPRLFKKASNYYQFVLERERLRDIHPYESLNKTFLFTKFYDRLSNRFPNSSEESIRRTAYEYTLKDMALTNVLNIPYLFSSNTLDKTSYADKVFDIIDKFPELKQNYDVLSMFRPKIAGGYMNLTINNAKKLTSEEINVYHENLLELSNPSQIKVDTSTENKNMIADLFSKIAFYAVLQAGFDTSTETSIQRITPQKEFLNYITQAGNKYIGKSIPKALLDEYYSKFVDVNTQKFLSTRFKDYNIFWKNPDMATQPSTSVKPTIDLSKEWSGDLNIRPVYTADGVNTMRTKDAVTNEHFGNPWSEGGYNRTIKTDSIQEAAQNYKDWLLTDKFLSVKPKQRAWILGQINEGKLDGAVLLYGGKLMARGQGSHAISLADVVEQLRSVEPSSTKEVVQEPFKSDYYGNKVYSPDLKLPELEKLIVDNPNSLLVYNDILAEPDQIVKVVDSLDWKLRGLRETRPDNVFGIPTLKKFSTSTLQGIIKDSSNGEADPEFKEAVDNAINTLKEKQAAGSNLIFNERGYGQLMMNVNLYTGKVHPSKVNSIENFKYLSEQLLRNFGFVNPNYLSFVDNAIEILQEQQPVSNQDVRDKLKICFT